MNITFKVNPHVARKLAKEIERTVARKTGKTVKIADAEVRKLQRSFNRFGK